MIPACISRQHVLQALEIINRHGVLDGRQSTKYCLVYQGRHFPPKYAVSLAHKLATGEELPAMQFNGGTETNSFLNGLGFQTVTCKCGGCKKSPASGLLDKNSSPGYLSDRSPKGEDRSASTPGVTVTMAPANHPQGSLDQGLRPDSASQLAEDVYYVLSRLPRRSYLTPLFQLPSNGIYVFFELGEICSIGGRLADRIVRIGTHKGDGNFPGRIRQHYGNVNSLSGNKNSSVFRMHVGGALMIRANPRDPRLPEWLHHMGQSYADVEEKVSRRLREKFTFVCFEVESKQERLSLEAGLIALFAQCPLGSPSEHWLGHSDAAAEIRRSGLWNVQHVDDVPLTDLQFQRLTQLVEHTLRKA